MCSTRSYQCCRLITERTSNHGIDTAAPILEGPRTARPTHCLTPLADTVTRHQASVEGRTTMYVYICKYIQKYKHESLWINEPGSEKAIFWTWSAYTCTRHQIEYVYKGRTV